MPSRIALILLLSLSAHAQTLREAAVMRGLTVGTATQPGLTRDAAYSAVLAREFNLIEPENEMKFDAIHPARDRYNFTNADTLATYAEANKMRFRGHTLVWHNQNPAWLTGGNFAPAELATIMKEHITAVTQHYAGKVYAWDVVNEPFNDDGTLRASIWSVNSNYIEQALRWTREADPATLLFINDYSNETIGRKSDALYNLARDLKARNVPLDGIGFQMHLTANANLSTLDANFKRFSDLGLLIEITELDVRLPVGANGAASPADLARQAEIYKTVFTTCLKFPACKTIQTWGFTDRNSWIPSAFAGFGAALPFDAAFQPKPAYTAIIEGLTQTPPAISASAVVNAASFTGGAVAPGELITLFGANFGPAALQTAQLDAQGRIATELATARLLFDGIPAPLIYVVQGQLAALVPYDIAGKTTTNMQYEFHGIKSNAAATPVTRTAPALFTANSSGKGPGAILNQDFSLNTAANPVEKNGIVSLFGTGAGETNPKGIDGRLAAEPYAKPVLPVTVDVDGQTAEVLYAGDAPGLASGIFQIAIRIPPNSRSGDVSIVVKVGDTPSQPGVTVAVR
jgi:endo-1,4-beta-xylanase